MGGVGTGLELPYSWLMRNNITVRGQWMYPPDAARRMVGMVRAGLVDLAPGDITAFPLEEANAAVAHAAAKAGPFNMTVIQP
jgi:alcohol dehydrogenase